MNVEQLAAANAANKKIQPVAGFSKNMPVGFDPESMLQDGDIIVFPEAMPQVFQQTFGENVGEFILVKVIRADKEIGFNFFPLSMLKNYWPAVKDENGVVTTITTNGPVNPKGTAVELFVAQRGKGSDSVTDTELGVQALLAKKVKVSKQQDVAVQKWAAGSPINELKNSTVWDYNLA